jgi:CheY-like chemotaxis protein
MNEETKQKLFEPFFTTKDVGKGTGLGLATVHGIVKQSGGNIWVYSEPDMGTTFNISLPQTESSPIVSTEPTAIPELVEGKVKVLLVEDDASLRKLFSRILKHLGYPVTTASNGIEAIAAVEEKGLRPDLIITDVVMPGMSGKVMVDKLRGILPDAMILFMSGYADNVIVHNGILDDGLPFIQKPFNSVDLNAKIREIMTSKNRSPLTEEITYEETDQP